MHDSTESAQPQTDAHTDRAEAGPDHGAQQMTGGRYRVTLDSYSGPLDLLLYLIRKHEVDIENIPIAIIAEQYQRYLDLMAQINVNVAGEFLVMASTLMEIKSRMLLPREEALEEDEGDPRDELVQQLLEYRKYKDAGRELGARARQAALRYPRPGPEALPDDFLEDDDADDAAAGLEGIGLWELIDAFARVVSQTELVSETRVLERERTIHEYRRDLLAMVEAEGTVRFSELFRRCRTREDLIGTFIALLELVRLRQLQLQQAAQFSEIYVCLADDTEAAREHERIVEDEAALAPMHRTPEPEGPVMVPEPSVLEEIEEEDAALGGARERIDAAIKQVEWFLEEHHRQVQEQAGQEDDEDEPADDDTDEDN